MIILTLQGIVKHTLRVEPILLNLATPLPARKYIGIYKSNIKGHIRSNILIDYQAPKLPIYLLSNPILFKFTSTKHYSRN